MEKELKRNIGDTVWFITDNKAVSGTIKDIYYDKSNTKVFSEEIKESESYYIMYSSCGGVYSDKDVFDTKEALLKSL